MVKYSILLQTIKKVIFPRAFRNALMLSRQTHPNFLTFLRGRIFYLRSDRTGQKFHQLLSSRLLNVLAKPKILTRSSRQCDHYRCDQKDQSLSLNSYFKFLNPHALDRFTPSRARYAEKCGSALTHRLFGKKGTFFIYKMM